MTRSTAMPLLFLATLFAASGMFNAGLHEAGYVLIGCAIATFCTRW